MVVTALAMGKPYQSKDGFFYKAKQEGLRARSAFKLLEIVQRFRILRAGARVLDLGAAPGGFLQIIADRIGKGGRVVGVDRVPVRPFALTQVVTLVADVLDPGFDQKLAEVEPGPFDAVISDLAPKTTGIKTTDEARSLALARRALELSLRQGKKGSSFVAKLFMGEDFPGFRSEVERAFGEVKIVRPEATRGASFEIYVVGLDKRE